MSKELSKNKYLKILFTLIIVLELGSLSYDAIMEPYFNNIHEGELRSQLVSLVKDKHPEIKNVSYDLTNGLKIIIEPSFTIEPALFKDSINQLSCAFLKRPDVMYKAINTFVVYGSDVRFPIENKLIGSWLFFSDKCT
ncbi:hypothetical protein ACLKMH_10940 [Psychromonas sp. KJ10-10]|uniref:hypothetical protein n=1 Tax=Psychromonas sp. KJ10-10 TaxID=3391823 RepID=UPI0039B6B70D